MNEEWRDIEGYEELYQVSNLGRVKSLNYRDRSDISKCCKAKLKTAGKYKWKYLCKDFWR